MTQVSPTGANARDEVPRRPKGILKNSNSYQLASPTSNAQSVPTSSTGPTSPFPSDPEPVHSFAHDGAAPASNPTPVHPGIQREVSDKELTLANTLANAGPRRNSSNTRGSVSGSASRRHSSATMDVDGDENEGPRLKWDEANLYLAEQERGTSMKIDEPKTPWAKQYDPVEDEEELAGINTQGLVVDELDKAKGVHASSGDHGINSAGSSSRRTEPIPDLDLGEPEEPVNSNFPIGDGEKRVIVDESTVEDTGPGHHGEEPDENMTSEQLRKHRQFEERRRKHYEMHNVKDMLSHPEENMDEVEEEDGQVRPPLPR